MNIDEIRQAMLRKESLSDRELEEVCSALEEYFSANVRGDYYTRDATWLIREYVKVHETEREFGKWLQGKTIKPGPHVLIFMNFCK